jgi:hypothetical protein
MEKHRIFPIHRFSTSERRPQYPCSDIRSRGGGIESFGYCGEETQCPNYICCNRVYNTESMSTPTHLSLPPNPQLNSYQDTLHLPPHQRPQDLPPEIQHRSLSLRLTPEDIVEIEKGYDFHVGFPHNFVNRTNSCPPGPENVTTVRLLGYFDYVKGQEAIKRHQGELNVQ